MITTERLSDHDVYYVEREVRPGHWQVITRAAANYETAVAWAHAANDRVVLRRTTVFVCEGPPNTVVHSSCECGTL